MMFPDREDAARQLAQRIKPLKLKDPLVLGIPRGGVLTGAVLARELGAELDIVLSRKLRAPWQHEFALGAISEDGQVYLNPEAQDVPGVTKAYLESEKQLQMNEIQRRAALFRQVRPAARVAGRTVIVTDDGIATGATIMAALSILRAQKPHELIVAAPVGPLERIEEIGRHCDRVIYLEAPASFWAVGQFYDDFHQIDDAEAIEILREFAAPPAAHASTGPERAPKSLM